MLTAEQKEEIEYIKDRVLAKFPLLGVTMSKLEVEADDNVGTAMTTGEKIYYSPKYFSELSDDEEVFVFSHEVFHVAFEHIPRCKGHDMDLWNIATDAVINQLLKQEGLPIKEGLVDIPDALGRSAEEMYNILWERREQKLREWQEHIQEMMEKAKSMREEQLQKEAEEEQKRAAKNDNRRGQSSETEESSGSGGSNSSSREKGEDRDSSSENSEAQQNKGEDKNKPSEKSETQATDKSAKQDETAEKSSQTSEQQSAEASQNQPQNAGDKAQQGQPEGKDGREPQNTSEQRGGHEQPDKTEGKGAPLSQGNPQEKNGNEQQNTSEQQGDNEQQNEAEEDPIDKWATQPPQMPELPEFKFNQTNHEIWKEILEKKHPNKQADQQQGGEMGDDMDGMDGMGDMGDMRDIEKQFSHQNQREQAKQAMQYFGSPAGYGSSGGRGGGSFHMGGDDWVGTKRAKELDWKRLLKNNIDTEIEAWSDRRAEEENDFSSRLEEVEREDKAHTEVMLDISGSVDVNLLKEFLRQLKPLLKDSTLSVGYFNDSASDFTPVKTIKDIERLDIPEPDGGTNLDAAVRSFSKNKRTSKIVFTDGYGIMPGEDLKKTNVIWVVYDNDGRFSPCCGKVIYVDENRIMEEGQRRSFLISNAKGTSRK